MLFFAMFLIFARLARLVSMSNAFLNHRAHLFWNQICTERSVMLMSEAILSRVAAVGVGFLLNSTSRVTSWS